MQTPDAGQRSRSARSLIETRLYRGTPCRPPRAFWHLWLLVFTVLASGCRVPGQERQVTIRLYADAVWQSVQVREGLTVAEVLAAAGFVPGELDRVEPPLYAVVGNGDEITLTRVVETFETRQSAIPFERQSLRNETMAEGESQLIQSGAEGLQETTYRITFQDGEETQRIVVKTTVLVEPRPEIVMVGAQPASAPLSLPGVLAYLAGGNAWIMEGSTSNRRLLVSSADLDGRVFSLSPEGDYLIFTRKSKKPADAEINTLWAIETSREDAEPRWLQASNVVHFAAWIPGTSSVAYSTVEPRAAAPGWQANNDLYRVSVAGGPPRRVLDASDGGIYGWWGMTFAFAPDGRLAYARPDQVGLVDQDGGYLKPLMDVTPYNARADWAWLPGITWGGNGDVLYMTTHAPAGAPVLPEDSPHFDLAAASMENSTNVPLARDTGMFSYAAASHPQDGTGRSSHRVAFLQASLPEQSDHSRYRLVVMDRDGSNQGAIFPPPDSGGLEPQMPVWAPAAIAGQSGDYLAIIFQGNLWLLDSGSGAAYQVTGDRLITRIDWQ